MTIKRIKCALLGSTKIDLIKREDQLLRGGKKEKENAVVSRYASHKAKRINQNEREKAFASDQGNLCE